MAVDEGGVVDLLAGGEQQQEQQQTGGQEQQQQEQQSQGGEDWLKGFSADPVGDAPSNLDYLKAKGFKDPNALAQSYRALEQQLSGKGVIVKPGDGASEDAVKAYRTAIGVPDAVDGYTVPEAPEGLELDTAFLDPLRAKALEAGVPAEGFSALANQFVEHQLNQMAEERTRQDGLRDAKLKEWGANEKSNLALAQRGIKAFGLDGKDVAALQRGLGSDRMLDLALKLGQVGAEDTLLRGDKNGGSFGIASKAEAQSRIDAIIKDPAKAAAVKVKGSAAEQEWKRLNGAVAHFTDAEKNAQ